MKKLGFLALVMVMALGVGCAQKKPLTPEEIAAERERQIAATTRIYEGKTPEEVLLAAATVLRWADDDYDISHTSDSVHATRNWMYIGFIVIPHGTDRWTINAESVANGTKVKAACFVDDNMAARGGKEAINNGLFSLFYGRLDYILGNSKNWLTCKDARKIYTDYLDPLCTVATDRTPDGKSAVERQKEQENRL